jgi:hypothetical protein
MAMYLKYLFDFKSFESGKIVTASAQHSVIPSQVENKRPTSSQAMPLQWQSVRVFGKTVKFHWQHSGCTGSTLH